MIEWIEFKNFKALRDTKLLLSPFTLIVGANGSGKSTALNAILALAFQTQFNFDSVLTAGAPSGATTVTVRAKWRDSIVQMTWSRTHGTSSSIVNVPSKDKDPFASLRRARGFSFDANLIAQPIQLQPDMELQRSGLNLPGVLDRMRDKHPERFEALNQELMRWIPEFDRVLFETFPHGQRAIALRTREGRYTIKATDLSQGTLIALALLTIAYLPEPPSIVCLEEPDHGLHPRLLRDVRDALYRLAYPDGAKEKREPVQVIATTHNPYFLDLFREHPEEIVIAEKVGLEGKFSRLSDRADLEEILGDAPLSEVWYSGVLGGVPTGA